MQTFLTCRCRAPAECVPEFRNSDVIGLPVSNRSEPLRLLGLCVEPCSQDCAVGAQNLQCGTDGRTYYNVCYRNCANVQVSTQNVTLLPMLIQPRMGKGCYS